MPCNRSPVHSSHNGKPNLFLNLKQSYPRVVEALTVKERGICTCPKNCPAAESILEMCEKYLVPRSMRKFDKQIQTAICYFPPASGSVAKVDRQARHGGEPCAVASVTLWSILCLLPCCMNANIYISQKEFEYVCWIWKVLMNWGWSTFRDGHLPWSGQHSIWYFMAKTNIIHKDLELRRMSQGKSRLQTVWKRGLQMVVWRQAKRGKRTLWKGLKGSSPGFTVFRHISTYWFWQALEVFWILLPCSQGLGSSGPTAVKMDRCLVSAESLNCHQHSSQCRLTAHQDSKNWIYGWKSDSTKE